MLQKILRTTIWLGLLILLAACASPVNLPTAEPLKPKTAVIETSLPSLTPSRVPTRRPKSTSTITPSPPPSRTASPVPTMTPTYTILRGKVLVLSNCRYGPGEPYLYKYALIAGSNLEVIGRNEAGTWLLVQAMGGNNPCWVKASLMELQGEVKSVQPTRIPLPMSPYYGPLTRYSAVREGDEVTIMWGGIQLRAGDDSGQYPYLIEAWVCREGKQEFIPMGTYETAVKLRDESGCAETSQARLYAVEKHGYTQWVEIPWPEQQ